MSHLIVIPVRMSSTRFPGKPLALIQSLPMMHWVYNQVNKFSDNCLLAICDEETKTYCMNHKLKFVETSKNHESGSDRVGEVLEKFSINNEHLDYIINIQGDMPFIKSEHINYLIQGLQHHQMSTLACEFKNREEYLDENKVKVIIDKKGNAQNFFRQPIDQSNMNKEIFHHIGVYGYRTDFLKNFLELPQSDLEREMKLEQLRIKNLDNIYVKIINENILGVDTERDLMLVNNILNNG